MDIAFGDAGLSAPDALAPAKINLALHITGRRDDGYHQLDSLVVFAEDGDRLSLRQSTEDRFTVNGPFAARLPTDRGNLVLRALDLCRAVATANGITIPPLALHLHKKLPLASGIGGGSADAAALIRLLGTVYPTLRPEFQRRSVTLGADVPMCISSLPARVRGIGEIETPLCRLKGMGMLLVNSGHAISTPAAFTGLSRRDNPPLPDVPGFGFSTFRDLIDYLGGTRNDLEAPALQLTPSIRNVKDALMSLGAGFVRMSGSGATVFALFETADEAKNASARVQVAHPEWWALATRVRSIS